VRLCAAGKSHYLPNQNVMQIGRRSVCANAILAARAICLDLIVDCFDTQERRRPTRVCLVKSSQHSTHFGTRILTAKFVLLLTCAFTSATRLFFYFLK